MLSKNVKLEDIDASLSYGQIFSSKKWTHFFVFIYILIGVAVAICVTVIVGVIITTGEFDSDAIAMVVALGFLGLLLLSMILLQSFVNKGKRKAACWLEDAVVLEAWAESIGQTLHIRNILVRTATAIEVSFEYNGKRYIRQSVYKDKTLYSAVFTKYVNKKIMIAYSSLYDEVMLIKPSYVQSLKNGD